VPHYLIVFVSPLRNFTAADWARAASDKIEEIEGRDHPALLVGGTGFYLRALRRPFFESPPTDEDLRVRLTRIREQHGPEHLHRILQRLDAAEATKLSPRDWPRVHRAIEFCLQTGEPISRQKPLRPEPPSLAARIQIIALGPPRQQLYQRTRRGALRQRIG
jgi:tRNA dimethylallyltransferase